MLFVEPFLNSRGVPECVVRTVVGVVDHVLREELGHDVHLVTQMMSMMMVKATD